MSATEARLRALGLTLPPAAAPVANYVPHVRAGVFVVISGQIPYGSDGALSDAHKGRLGGGVTPEIGVEAARLCALNVLAQLKAAVGSLDEDRVRRCVRLGGFINVAPGYTGIAAIMNGASDLVVEVLGERGRHARSTVGVAELPLGVCVEVEGLFEVA